MNTIEIELPNVGTNTVGKKNDYTVVLPEVLNIPAGSVVSISQAYLSTFSNGSLSYGQMILEQDYKFVMKGLQCFTPYNDSLTSENNQFLIGYNGISMTVLTEEGGFNFIDIEINIEKGSYTPQQICNMFNRQANDQIYLTSQHLVKQYPQLDNLSLLTGVINDDSAGEGLNFKTAGNSGPYIGGNCTSVGVSCNDIGTVPTLVQNLPESTFVASQIYSGSSFNIAFNTDSGKFYIQSNFNPIADSSGQNIILVTPYASTVGGTVDQVMFYDRMGEVLIQYWGYDDSDEFTGSFWDRLGFARADLYPTIKGPGEFPKYAFGRCYPILSADMFQTNTYLNYLPVSDQLKAIKPGCQIYYYVSNDPAKNNSTYAIAYDGSATTGVTASKTPIYMYFSYCRIVLDIIVNRDLSGSINNNGHFGFIQSANLLNQSNGFLSYSIFNPTEFTINSAIAIKSIGVRIENPLTNDVLSYISDGVLSSIFLRIISPLSNAINKIEDSNESNKIGKKNK